MLDVCWLVYKSISIYPAQIITDADYADDIALLATIPALAESLHTLGKAAGIISIYVNAEKTEYMCFNQNQTIDILTLTGALLKLVDKFTHLGSSVSSTENDINTRLAKTWLVFDRLSVIWKLDLSYKTKGNIFQAAVVSILVYGCTTWMVTKCMEKMLTAIVQECYEPY